MPLCPAREISVPGFTGLLSPGVAPASAAAGPDESWEREIARLADPGAALRTLHWGRNYLYVARLTTRQGELEVVVKQFRNRNLRDRLLRRLRGSKAERSWRVAHALLDAGLLTPEPVALLEATCATGPSLYVCRYLAGALEARYLLRAANAGTAADLFPDVDLELFLRDLGHTARRLHEARFWHRDLSIGNVLLLRGGEAGATAGIYLVDLNRTRMERPLTASERLRDLSRLAIFRPEHRRIFLDSYWGDGREGGRWRKALYLTYHHGFLWRNRLKGRLRRAARPGGGRSLLPRAPHAHIPDPPSDATRRDKVVWDRLSDQPHQHAGKVEKLRVRLSDAREHAREAAAVAQALPGVWQRYRELRRELYREPRPWGGAGVCLRPWPEAPERLLALVEELGARHLLLRLHLWEDDPAALELARELHARGYELAFALPQNRELVRDPGRWRAGLERVAELYAPYGRQFQVGQAINRSKWGIWTVREYVALLGAAEEVLRRVPGAELLGPSVIDFEFHFTAAVLNLAGADFHFDAVASLLYVDRRGAPENRQAGFDTVGKVLLLKAIAETARNARSGRCWITEVNWPLREGPHSPAGRAVAVGEEEQADYLSRYYLLTLGTGLVERVFWWQAVARGYGLVDPADRCRPRRRPSFRALQTLLAQLEGSEFEANLAAPEGTRLQLYRRPDGRRVAAGWSVDGARTVILPRPAAAVIGRGGQELPPPPGREAVVTSSPSYFQLED